MRTQDTGHKRRGEPTLGCATDLQLPPGILVGLGLHGGPPKIEEDNDEHFGSNFQANEGSQTLKSMAGVVLGCTGAVGAQGYVQNAHKTHPLPGATAK